MLKMEQDFGQIRQILNLKFPKFVVETHSVEERHNHCCVCLIIPSVEIAVIATEDVEAEGCIDTFIIEDYGKPEEDSNHVCYELSGFPYRGPESVCKKLTEGIQAVIAKFQIAEDEERKQRDEVEKDWGERPLYPYLMRSKVVNAEANGDPVPPPNMESALNGPSPAWLHFFLT